MSRNFEELAFVPTPLGDLSLRRQRLMMLGGREIFEIKLNQDYLMSSLFTTVEVALAERSLALLTAPHPDVVIGGLGLGYTTAAVLDKARVRSVIVVDALDPVIDWHRRGLVPLGPRITTDPRCRLVCGDFFALTAPTTDGYDPDEPGRRFDAILLDIDHSPRHLLHPRHAAFYGVEGLQYLSGRLRQDGVFGMWSDAPIDEAFLADLRAVFTDVRAELVSFSNPFLGEDSHSVVYLGRRRPDEGRNRQASPSRR